MVTAALLGAGLWAGSAAAQDVAAGVSSEGVHYSGQVAPAGTPVRLMFLTEITSSKAVEGQRFKMRVNEPVYAHGQVVIPVGASAWGEVTSVDGNGAGGKRGKLGMRILYLDLPGGRLPLKGDVDRKGGGNGAGIAFAVIGFGIFGLLTSGDSARFKGGDLITVFVDDAVVPAPETLVVQPAEVDGDKTAGEPTGRPEAEPAPAVVPVETDEVASVSSADH